MSVRVITKRQFSDGTTIDGNRIEGALQDVERFVDEVPSQFVKNRYTQSQLVSGWSPATAAFGALNDSHPFMVSVNAGPDVKNPTRLKGYFRDDSTLADQYIWNQAFQPNRTVIIHAFDLIMAQDPGTSGLGGIFVMGSTAYPNYAPPNLTDIELHITIDAPFVPEDRSQNDMEIHKRSFTTDSWLVTPIIRATPSDDMLPALNGGGLSGFSININDLNIPIAPYSRVRYAVIIPKYAGGSPGETNWKARPWANSVYSQVLTILEPNDRG